MKNLAQTNGQTGGEVKDQMDNKEYSHRTMSVKSKLQRRKRELDLLHNTDINNTPINNLTTINQFRINKPNQLPLRRRSRLVNSRNLGRIMERHLSTLLLGIYNLSTSLTFRGGGMAVGMDVVNSII